MKGRSSKQGSKGDKGVLKNNLHHKLNEEPHLSGAYIRGLVKQLTSSRIKEPMNPNDQNTMEVNQFSSYPNLDKFVDEGQRSVPPQHKKQVRRRLHTTRPYQERLLNMAEARKEIVTALKLHRASMKKQADEPNKSDPPSQEETIKPRRNSRTYPPKESMKYLSNQSDISSNSMCHSTLYPSCSSNPYSFWPGSGIANFPDNLNFSLPSQTLGLNLNIQEFDNLDKTFYQDTNNSSCSYSSPKSNLVSSDGETTNVVPKSELHQVIDEEEMAEIKSMGEQHEVEWNDSVNLVTSAWWFKFLDSNERGKGDAYSPLDDDVAQFPDWLNSDGSSCLEQDYVMDNYLDDCLQDPSLPCLDIGEIEGMDGEWLA